MDVSPRLELATVLEQQMQQKIDLLENVMKLLLPLLKKHEGDIEYDDLRQSVKNAGYSWENP